MTDYELEFSATLPHWTKKLLLERSSEIMDKYKIESAEQKLRFLSLCTATVLKEKILYPSGSLTEYRYFNNRVCEQTKRIVFCIDKSFLEKDTSDIMRELSLTDRAIQTEQSLRRHIKKIN